MVDVRNWVLGARRSRVVAALKREDVDSGWAVLSSLKLVTISRGRWLAGEIGKMEDPKWNRGKERSGRGEGYPLLCWAVHTFHKYLLHQRDVKLGSCTKSTASRGLHFEATYPQKPAASSSRELPFTPSPLSTKPHSPLLPTSDSAFCTGVSSRFFCIPSFALSEANSRCGLFSPPLSSASRRPCRLSVRRAIGCSSCSTMWRTRRAIPASLVI